MTLAPPLFSCMRSFLSCFDLFTFATGEERLLIQFVLPMIFAFLKSLGLKTSVSVARRHFAFSFAD